MLLFLYRHTASVCLPQPIIILNQILPCFSLPEPMLTLEDMTTARSLGTALESHGDPPLEAEGIDPQEERGVR